MSRRPLLILQAVLTGIVVIAGLVCILALYGQMSRIGEEEVLRSLDRTAAQIAINLNERMLSVNDACLSLLNDSRFQDSVHRSPSAETLQTQLEEIRPLREALMAVQKNRFITQIRVYLNDQKMLTREGVNFFSLTEAMQTPEYQEMMNLTVNHHWFGSHPVKTLYFEKECITLGFLYQRKFWTDSPNWALLLFDISPEVFEDALDGMDTPDEQDAVAVVNSAGQPMFGTGDEAVFSRILDIHPKRETNLLTVNDTEYAYVTHPLKIEDWSLVMYTPRAGLLSSQQTIRRFLPLMIFGLTLFLIALIVILSLAVYSWRINAYIRTLDRNLQNRNRPADANTPAHSGLFNLDRSIADLLDTNKQLAEEKLNAQLREREVALQALQAQINPHFLYNTLDSINWMAIRAHASEVSEAITALADYFRISLSRGQSVVPLKDDAEIARKYLLLYEHRSDYEFEVMWALEPETLSCDLPKLTLQPLLENALQHGIFQRREKKGGVIRVCAVLEDGQLVLTVADNGPGITQDFQWDHGYGLSNVRKRLDLYFNNRYDINLTNAQNGGAVVTIKVSKDLPGL